MMFEQSSNPDDIVSVMMAASSNAANATGDTVVNIAGLSALASLGDMMPPTALAGLFAAQVTGVEKYSRVLKRCLIPCIIIMVWAAVVIFFSGTIGGWF